MIVNDYSGQTNQSVRRAVKSHPGEDRHQNPR